MNSDNNPMNLMTNPICIEILMHLYDLGWDIKSGFPQHNYSAQCVAISLVLSFELVECGKFNERDTRTIYRLTTKGSSFIKKYMKLAKSI